MPSCSCWLHKPDRKNPHMWRPKRSIYSHKSFKNVTVLLAYKELLSSTFIYLQWQSLIQDLQAEEEHPRGLPPVWAAETRRGDAGQWKLEAGCHAAWGRGSQWVDCCQQWVDEYDTPVNRNQHSLHKQAFQFSKKINDPCTEM